VTHQINELNQLIPPIILSIITGMLFFLFYVKRKQTSVHALDWLMAIFGSVSLLGITQITKLFLHEKIPIFGFEGGPLGLDLVRTVHLLSLIVLYRMSESFLSDRLNSIRLTLVTALISMYYTIAIIYIARGVIIETGDIIPFAKDISRLDALIFDTLQVFIISMIFYVFYEQYRISDNNTIRKYLGIILIAVLIFLITSLIELFEHFFLNSDINAFQTAIPTFLLLAYFYIKNPNFVYLAPANVSFLQLVKKDGTLLYAAELTNELNTTDFLIAPSLTSISSMLNELLSGSTDRMVELKKFDYIGGFILFEKIGSINAILQTDRPSMMLKRSMRYFLREFIKEYEEQIDNYKGFIGKSASGLSPDDLFIKCIPIVQSKAIKSSFTNANKTLS